MHQVPLAEKLRPKSFAEIIGQEQILSKNSTLNALLENNQLTNLIFWGPPGTGKTSLARLIASRLSNYEFIELSAVTSSKKDVLDVVARARVSWNLGIRTILFIDEIHRFNKAQQDAFLPHLESGLITLIGATTENPSFEIITPLMSRSTLVIFNKLSETALESIIRKALKFNKSTKLIKTPVIKHLAKLADGDARKAIGLVELVTSQNKALDLSDIKRLFRDEFPGYDKAGDSHYDTISAFIKSLRGSDEIAATYYLARMLQAGEDPKFISRRLIVFASEDIGLAGNGALSLTIAAFDAVQRVGLPEAEHNLYHAVIALARSQKSREVTNLMNNAKEIAREFPNSTIPISIKNAPTKLARELGHAKDYHWEANFQPPNGFLPKDVAQKLKK